MLWFKTINSHYNVCLKNAESYPRNHLAFVACAARNNIIKKVKSNESRNVQTYNIIFSGLFVEPDIPRAIIIINYNITTDWHNELSYLCQTIFK